MQICRAHEAVESAPETRAELVARLQREVAEGTYRVDTRALAQRLLPVLFPDQFGE
jgi:anti-sigma28 factor (negative regulator of flagellin synthesis)